MAHANPRFGHELGQPLADAAEVEAALAAHLQGRFWEYHDKLFANPRALHEPADGTPLAHRPAWLLPKPRRCDIRDYQLLAGPERIESGWWDGRDCRRDYFVVRDRHGSLLWAFHEYKPKPGWYLHGIFA